MGFFVLSFAAFLMFVLHSFLYRVSRATSRDGVTGWEVTHDSEQQSGWGGNRIRCHELANGVSAIFHVDFLVAISM